MISDNKTIYLGLDPGFTGYITIIDHDGNHVKSFKTPIIQHTTKIKRNKTKYSKSGKLQYEAGHISTHTETELDQEAILTFMSQWTDRKVVVAIEKQFMIPGQGAASSSKTLIGYGFWCGLTLALGMERHLITAREWQDSILEIPTTIKRNTKEGKEATKRFSVAAVKEWRKDLDLRRTNKSKIDDHNLADSVNIARYCWKSFRT